MDTIFLEKLVAIQILFPIQHKMVNVEHVSRLNLAAQLAK